MALRWTEEFDVIRKRLIDEAPSPYTDEGSPFYFRIAEMVSRKFKLISDAELMCDGDHDKRFTSLAEAKEYCEEQNRQAIQDIEHDRSRS